VVAASANADGVIEKEEKNLFYYFLESAHLPTDQRKDALEMIRNPVRLEDIDLSRASNWVVKKYFLEMAILTIWADRKVTDSERVFLQKLCRKLDLLPEELETSMISIESFVLEHWSNIHFLQKKHNFYIVRDHVTQTLALLLAKNKDRIAQEIRESKELMMLLNKSRKTQLSALEKEKVREQLLDILRILPTAVIIALPFTFITLPVLLKVMPKEAFPSAFRD